MLSVLVSWVDKAKSIISNVVLMVWFKDDSRKGRGKCHALAASKGARLSNILRVTRLELWL